MKLTEVLVLAGVVALAIALYCVGLDKIIDVLTGT